MQKLPITTAKMFQESYEFSFDGVHSCAHNVARIITSKMVPGDILRFEVPASIMFASDVTRDLRRLFREKDIVANTSTHGRMVTVIFNGLKGE